MSLPITVKLDDLHLAEKNVRMHPSTQIREYRRSLQMFGQTKNAVIDENNVVLIGNGLVIAAREEGWTEIFVIQRTGLSENEKLKLMVSDNKIFGLGVDNLDVIDEIFHQLKGDLSIPGYDENILESMIAEAVDVTAHIADFGKLDNDTIANLQNRTVGTPSYEPPPLPPTLQGTSSPSTPHTSTNEYTPPQAPQENDQPDPKDFIQVKCGECGVIKWLSKEQLRPLM